MSLSECRFFLTTLVPIWGRSEVGVGLVALLTSQLGGNVGRPGGGNNGVGKSPSCLGRVLRRLPLLFQ